MRQKEPRPSSRARLHPHPGQVRRVGWSRHTQEPSPMKSRRLDYLRYRVILRLERLETRTTPASLTPAQVRHAYGLDQIAGDGAGQTIAIVDAYDHPTIASDLHQFSATFG